MIVNTRWHFASRDLSRNFKSLSEPMFVAQTVLESRYTAIEPTLTILRWKSRSMASF